MQNLSNNNRTQRVRGAVEWAACKERNRTSGVCVTPQHRNHHCNNAQLVNNGNSQQLGEGPSHEIPNCINRQGQL